MLPAGYMNQPEIRSDLLVFWDAFWALSPDRSSGFGLGPIPFASIDRWAARFGFDAPEDFERLVAMVRALDVVFLEHHRPKKSPGSDDETSGPSFRAVTE